MGASTGCVPTWTMTTFRAGEPTLSAMSGLDTARISSRSNLSISSFSGPARGLRRQVIGTLYLKMHSPSAFSHQPLPQTTKLDPHTN